MKVLNILKKTLIRIRLFRSIHFSGLVLAGALIASEKYSVTGLENTLDINGLLLLMGSIIFAWHCACIVNDFADLEDDMIGNPDRPLVSGKVSKFKYSILGVVFFLISVFFSIAVSNKALVMVLLFQLLYFIYSVREIRLKRFFPLNVFIVASNSMVAFCMGYFSLSDNIGIDPVFTRLFAALFVSYFLGANIIHLKDAEGDKEGGINTIPSLLGEKTSKYIISLLVFLTFISIPLLLNLKSLMMPSIFFALLASCTVLLKKWRESYFFASYFVYFWLFLVRAIIKYYI